MNAWAVATVEIENPSAPLCLGNRPCLIVYRVCFGAPTRRASALFAGHRRRPTGAAGTVRRAELIDDEMPMTAPNDLAVRRALEAAGVEFIDEHGGGPRCSA